MNKETEDKILKVIGTIDEILDRESCKLKNNEMSGICCVDMVLLQCDLYDIIQTEKEENK